MQLGTGVQSAEHITSCTERRVQSAEHITSRTERRGQSVEYITLGEQIRRV